MSLSLQLALYRRQRQQIRRAVEGAPRAFRAYEARYRRHTGKYQRALTFDQVARQALAADIVYVGDYHTLQAAQRTYQQLVGAGLRSGRRVVLALEWVEARHQDALDALLAGKINEATFLSRMGHAARTRGFDLGSGFLPILEQARARGLAVLGIDRRAQGPHSLRIRDTFAAERIARTAAAPDRPLVLVLMGQFHVAPCHLPARVEAALGDLERRTFVVYQNCEALYWHLAARGRSDVEAVQLRAGEACVFNASPVICQQSFLDYLDAEAGDEPLSERGLTDRFRELARLIARFVGVRVDPQLAEVEVGCAADLDFLQRVKRRGHLSARELSSVRRQVLDRESYYIPQARMAYLGSLSLNHAAEEAAHFVRHCCVGPAMAAPRAAQDAFYARVLEEALGFFGSRLVNPSRSCPDVSAWARIFQTARGETRRVAAFVLAHKAAELDAASGMLPVQDESLFHAVTHALGYLLGDALARAHERGELGHGEVRALFRNPFAAPRATYAELSRRLASPFPQAA